MNDYTTNTTPEAIAARLRAAERVAITTHRKPDGDALGSCLALARALEAAGTGADIFVIGPVPPPLAALTPPTPVHVDVAPEAGAHDVIVVLDTGAWTQVEALAPWLRADPGRVIGLDHHPRGDADMAARRLVDPAAASATMVLVPVLDALGATIDGGPGSVGEALFVGLATDTGWFRFSSADATAFALAARLLEAGVDKGRLYRAVEENHRPVRLALAARALASLRYARDGAVAIMRLGPDDFAATGGAIEDLAGVVNLPMEVGGVLVSILATQVAAGETKLSLRSKPAALHEEAARLDGVGDVNALAAHFGGGGHVHAAGARVEGEIDEVIEKVATLVEV